MSRHGPRRNLPPGRAGDQPATRLPRYGVESLGAGYVCRGTTLYNIKGSKSLRSRTKIASDTPPTGSLPLPSHRYLRGGFKTFPSSPPRIARGNWAGQRCPCLMLPHSADAVQGHTRVCRLGKAPYGAFRWLPPWIPYLPMRTHYGLVRSSTAVGRNADRQVPRYVTEAGTRARGRPPVSTWVLRS